MTGPVESRILVAASRLVNVTREGSVDTHRCDPGGAAASAVAQRCPLRMADS